jgi:hypothetical protein
MAQDIAEGLMPILPLLLASAIVAVLGIYFAWREREEDKAAKARRAARRQHKSA